MKLNIKLENNWLESTWAEDEIQVHCESFSGHPEHIAMLRAKALEYGTELDEVLIAECVTNFVMPTEAELLLEANRIKVAEAYAYLANTAWYVERLNDPSSGKAIPQEVLDQRAQARLTINELEVK